MTDKTRISEEPTPELRAKHSITTLPLPNGHTAHRVDDQRRIDTLHNRGNISQHQHRAAEKLMRDAYHGGVWGGNRSILDRTIPGGGDPEAQQRARERYRHAQMELMELRNGPKIWGVVERVVIFDEHLAMAAVSSGAGPRRGGDFLRAGLDHLAVVYGFVSRRQ